MCRLVTNPAGPHQAVAVQMCVGVSAVGHTAHAAFHSSIVKVALRTRKTDPEVVVSHGLIYSPAWVLPPVAHLRASGDRSGGSCVSGGSNSIAYLLWFVKRVAPRFSRSSPNSLEHVVSPGISSSVPCLVQNRTAMIPMPCVSHDKHILKGLHRFWGKGFPEKRPLYRDKGHRFQSDRRIMSN